MATSNQSFANALEDHMVEAKVIEIDYHRSFAAFGSVDTHFIIKVQPRDVSTRTSRFKMFRIEKSFKDFRSLVTEFKRASNETTDDILGKGQPELESTETLMAFSDAFSHVIDSSPKTYLGKMSFYHVEKLAAERKDILNKAIVVMMENYPDKESQQTIPTELFKKIVTEFFLTDHVYDDDNDMYSYGYDSVDSQTLARTQTDELEMNVKVSPERHSPPEEYAKVSPTSKSYGSPKESAKRSPIETAKKTPMVKVISPPISPHSQAHSDHGIIRPKSLKKRLSHKSRMENEAMFASSSSVHMYEGDDEMNESNSSYLDSPKSVGIILVAAVHSFLLIPNRNITVQLDISVLICFSVFVFGMYWASPSEQENEMREPDEHYTRNRADSATLARRVLGDNGNTKMERNKNGKKHMMELFLYTDGDNAVNGLLQKFPSGAALGSRPNCWSSSDHADFHVRGANYLKDKVKYPSGEFLFPARGVEVFLTDCCPENIGRYKVMMDQKLREKPSFIVNFRLPWGVVVFTNEIPAKYLPFLNHRYNPTSSPPSTNGLSPQEVCACRFLLGDDNHRCKTLKIVPSVAKGPWIVKKVVDGKPAIVGSKLPTKYFYEPANPSLGLAEYLEVDLDIVASSAARGILSVAQKYTKTLTLDLGFVIQGNSIDELPEQMLLGSRVHSLDPLTAPNLPEDLNSTS